MKLLWLFDVEHSHAFDLNPVVVQIKGDPIQVEDTRQMLHTNSWCRPLRGLTLFSLALLLPAAASAEGDPRLELGRTLFAEAEPPCALCHTLSDAGATGQIGPSLDVMRPEHETVMRAITQGIGPMLPYDGLSEEEKDAVAHYVSSVAGK